MTRDEILAMAREAGINLTPAQFSGVLEDEVDEFKLAAFAALVAAAEREACAKVCDELAKMAATPESAACWMRLDCATAIRKRGAA